ncbi:MAG: hypothetical protein P8H62_13660, partial [Henriciella sp.]|nr:hypothetical protein [Henriciella sp.]
NASLSAWLLASNLDAPAAARCSYLVFAASGAAMILASIWYLMGKPTVGQVAARGDTIQTRLSPGMGFRFHHA